MLTPKSVSRPDSRTVISLVLCLSGPSEATCNASDLTWLLHAQTTPYAVTPAAAAAASLVQQTIIAASQQQSAQIQKTTGNPAAIAPEAANTTTFPSTARFNAAPAEAPGASGSPSPVPQDTPTAAEAAEGSFGRHR